MTDLQKLGMKHVKELISNVHNSVYDNRSKLVNIMSELNIDESKMTSILNVYDKSNSNVTHYLRESSGWITELIKASK